MKNDKYFEELKEYSLKDLLDLQFAYELRLKDPNDISCVHLPKKGPIVCTPIQSAKNTLEKLDKIIKLKTNGINIKAINMNKLWELDTPRLKIYKKLCKKIFNNKNGEKICTVKYGKRVEIYRIEEIPNVIKIINIFIKDKIRLKK